MSAVSLMPWSQIQGHERWLELFRHAVGRQRLAHAYLFVGPPGVGKRMFALVLAKALLCERNPPGQLQACGQCDACLQVEARTHPDFFLVEKPAEDASEPLWTISQTPIAHPDKKTEERKSEELPIHVMLELCRLVGHKSARGRGRVVILSDADQFNDASANCFLKTLEEPPPGSVFILVCTSLENQPITIRSRCQVVRFAPLAENLVGDILGKRELPDPKLIPRLVKLAAGSPGRALDLAEPALWQFRNRLLQGLAQPKIDSVGLARSFIEFVEDAGKETAPQRRRAGQVLTLLLEAWGEALDRQLAGPPPASSEEAALVEPLARRASPDQILRVLERCLEAETHLDRYVQVGLVLEALLDALAQILEGIPASPGSAPPSPGLLSIS